MENVGRRLFRRRFAIRALLVCLASLVVMPAHAQSSREVRAAFAAVRDAILRHAQVWSEPQTPIASARLGENPPGPDSFASDAVVACRFRPGGVSGSTPKFDCELPDGDKVKIKYGRSNPEVFTEVAASRLLAALGFPADRMYVIDRVRCFGCPPDPFKGLQCLNDGGSIDVCFPRLDYSRAVEFAYAVIERPLKGRRVEYRRERGWGWGDLARIDSTAGGAPRAHVDALRLMAVFLGDWDNKPKNQRLICLGEKKKQHDEDEDELIDPSDCERPLAMVQDLGGTFGPFKLDLAGWNRTPIWKDAAVCRVSMRALPYGGSSFPDIQISEEGRAFLSGLLGQLTTAQIRALFEGARVADFTHKDSAARDVNRWVLAFQRKVRAIAERGPCPVTL